MVDINARPAAIGDVAAYRQSVLDLLRRADVVKASTEDLEVLLPDFEVADAARRVLAAGARVVLVTDGPRAVRVYGSGFRVEVPAPEANVVDTVGAGDAFGAGFLAWWHRRAYPHEALADRGLVVEAVGRAGEVAALTCARHGADPPHITDLSHGW
jgi:fructokinase